MHHIFYALEDTIKFVPKYKSSVTYICIKELSWYLPSIIFNKYYNFKQERIKSKLFMKKHFSKQEIKKAKKVLTWQEKCTYFVLNYTPGFVLKCLKFIYIGIKKIRKKK